MSISSSESFEWQVTYQEDDDSFFGSIQLSRHQTVALLVGSLCVYLASLGIVSALRVPLEPLLQWRSAHNLGLALWSAFFWLFTTGILLTEGHFESFHTAVCKPIEHKHFQLVSFLFVSCAHCSIAVSTYC